MAEAPQINHFDTPTSFLSDVIYWLWDEVYYRRWDGLALSADGSESGDHRSVARRIRSGTANRMVGLLGAGIDPVQDLLGQFRPLIDQERGDADHLYHRWFRREEVANAWLACAAAFCSPSELASCFGPAAGLSPKELRPVGFEHPRGEDGTYGRPDLLLKGDDVLLAVECKTETGGFRVAQLVKYLNVFAAVESRRATSCAFLLLCPSGAANPFVRGQEWVELSGHDASVRFRLENAWSLLSKRERSSAVGKTVREDSGRLLAQAHSLHARVAVYDDLIVPQSPVAAAYLMKVRARYRAS